MSVQKEVTTVTVMPLVMTLMGALSARVMLATVAMVLKGTAQVCRKSITGQSLFRGPPLQMWTSVQASLAILMPLAPIPLEVLSALVILAFLEMASTAMASEEQSSKY